MSKIKNKIRTDKTDKNISSDLIKIQKLKEKLNLLEKNYDKTKNPSLLSTINSLKNILKSYLEKNPEYFI